MNSRLSICCAPRIARLSRSGNCWLWKPGAAEEFAALRLGYTETAGNPELRREIAGLYQGITADDILVFAGAEEAIFIFMNAVLNAGEHLLVHSPCYQSLTAVAAGNGCQVTPWQTSQENGWELDLEFLEHSSQCRNPGAGGEFSPQSFRIFAKPRFF